MSGFTWWCGSPRGRVRQELKRCHQPWVAAGGSLVVQQKGNAACLQSRPAQLGLAGARCAVSVFFAGDFSAASLPSQCVSVPDFVPPRAAQIL